MNQHPTPHIMPTDEETQVPSPILISRSATRPAISEVGCQSKNDDEKWRMLMEQQNQNFLTLIRAMQTPSTTTDVQLPEFDPNTDVDARSWVTTAEICLADCPIQGGALLKALSRALKGQASGWLSQIAYPGMTWEDFKTIFTSRYECSETPAGFLVNLSNAKPKEGEHLAAYAANLMTSLMTRWKDLSIEQIAIATIMAHIANQEPRVQRLAFTADIKTRTKLIQELNAMCFLKRKAPVQAERNECDAKRSKPLPIPLKCYTCGKMGHKSATCFKNDDYMKKYNTLLSNPEPRAAIPIRTKTVTCYKCQGPGHYASRCPTFKNGPKDNGSGVERAGAVKQVDMCMVDAPTGTLLHLGEQFSYCYDSGAECSLIRDSISAKFNGKRLHNVVTMTGIGQTSVQSNLQIVTTVGIDGISLEIIFHVLPDSYLQHNIMIGREVLSQGLQVNITAKNLHFARILTINSCSDKSSHRTNFENINTDIPDEFKPNLLSVLTEFRDNFVEGTPVTPAKVDPVQIRLKDPNKTVYRRPYRLSPVECQIVRDKVDDLIASNVIRPSVSPFASPILLVKKKDGTDRLCVDYRELNDNTIPDRFPLPLISDQIDRLHGCYYFTTLDMASGFHQLPIHPDSVEKTAFVTPEGHYEYLTMPFGLRNAPSEFQRAITKVLGPLAKTYAVVYMDDILVIGNSDVKESLDRVRTVLKVLSEAGFSFNVKKCSFMKQKAEYLGFEASRGEIRPNSRKIEALVALSPPQTVAQVRQFIGLASYFRMFVPKFSQIMAPLYALTSIDKGQINWKSSHEAIRQKIVTILTNEPVLMIFNPNCPIELHTDASAVGYGAVLLQKKNNIRYPVAYFSKRTTSAESKYHSYELETLAVVNAIKHFRHYLHGRNFLVVTDCNSLQSSRKKLDLSPRVHRWWAYLQAFDFDIMHISGNRMSHADFFSRNPLPDSSDTPIVKAAEKRVDVTNLPDNWLLVEQQRDPEIAKLTSDLKDNKLGKDVSNTYEIRSGILHRIVQRNKRTRYLPIIPRALRWSVINSVHESLMHVGWEKTLEKAYDLYWFEHMSRYVRKFVDNCVTCKVSKSRSGKMQAELHPIPKASIPWHTVHIDATGKLSGKNDTKEYVWVLIDGFTKLVLLFHTMRIDTASSIRALKKSISLFGAPARIIADQGRCFASHEFREFCDSHNINLHLIATGTSRANGQVERIMSTLKNMLTAVETSKEQSWQDALPDVQLALNCTMNRVTKCSPLELMIGKVARPLDLLTFTDHEHEVDIENIRSQAESNITKSAQYEKVRFDRSKARVNNFAVGDFVLLQNEERNQTKLDPKYKGPFKVVEVLENDRYILKAPTGNRTYKYAHDRLRKMPDVQSSHETKNVESSDSS